MPQIDHSLYHFRKLSQQSLLVEQKGKFAGNQVILAGYEGLSLTENYLMCCRIIVVSFMLNITLDEEIDAVIRI